MATDLSQTTNRQHKPAIVSIAAAALLGFGLTLLAISAAYVRDLDTLRRVPEAIWLFVCGVPTDNALLLPLLIGFSTITVLVGVGLLFFGPMRRPTRKSSGDRK